MRLLPALAVIFLVVGLFTSDASPAEPLTEEAVLTTFKDSTLELQNLSRPTRRPTKAPRHKPTRKPTRNPNMAPSARPTYQPTSLVQEQGPYSLGGGKNIYPVNLPATQQPTAFISEVQPPHFGRWYSHFPFLAPRV